MSRTEVINLPLPEQDSRCPSPEQPSDADVYEIRDNPMYLKDVDWDTYADLLARSPFTYLQRMKLAPYYKSIPRSTPMSAIYAAELETYNMYAQGCTMEEIEEFYSSFAESCKVRYATEPQPAKPRLRLLDGNNHRD